MKRSKVRSSRANTCLVSTGAVLASALMAAMPAGASNISTGNPDLKARWDNTIRYNLGTRLQDHDSLVDRAGGFSFDQSNALFDKGDLITNRLDLLTEFDLSYKSDFGARVSAAAWYDAAYGKHAAHTANPSAYVNDEFTSLVKRFYAGPSGEILDAYLYGRFDLGAVPVDARLGKHVVIWGEGLFGSTNSVAYSQAPGDLRKATANPGASAKETALPSAQVSAVAQVSDNLSFAAQYTFKWAPNRIPEGGTYFAGADTILEGPNNAGRTAALDGSGGDIGLSMRWRPEWFDQGTLGIYYRKFDEKNSWASQLDAASGRRRAVYARDVELVGVSLAKVVGSVSVGSELSYRRNMPLNTRGATADARSEGARGETLHALVNGIKTFGNTAMFSSASVAAELAFTHLLKVTDNAAFYRRAGNAGAGCATEDILAGCSTTNFATAGVSFTPVWQQVLPGVDLSLPLFFSSNFKGNAATNGGGVEGFRTFKLTASATVNSKHYIDLAMTFYKGKTDPQRNLILGAPYNDKANLTLTYQTSF